ncbi:unnamed protein product [uncultured bacterium]|nr:unnamed protein product [uncultured bacterium]
MPTHTITIGVVSSGSSPISGSYSQVGTAEASIDTTLPAASTNTLVAVNYGAAGTATGNLLSIQIKASQNCTLKTNSSGSPTQTITLSANIPRQWDFTNPSLLFSGAVTAWYITCTNATRLQALILTA